MNTIEFGIIETTTGLTGDYVARSWTSVSEHASIAMYPTQPDSGIALAQSSASDTYPPDPSVTVQG